MGMLVQSVMRRAVVCADPTETVANVSDLMKNNHVRSVVICTPDKEVKGIVTTATSFSAV